MIGRQPTGRIVVMEDDAALAEILQVTLSEEGYFVEVRNLHRAEVGTIVAGQVGLILLGLHIIWNEPFRILDTLLADSSLATVPVICLTSVQKLAEPALRRRNVVGIIPEPFVVADLLAGVKAALS